MLVNYHKISFIKSPISAEPIQYDYFSSLYLCIFAYKLKQAIYKYKRI